MSERPPCPDCQEAKGLTLQELIDRPISECVDWELASRARRGELAEAKPLKARIHDMEEFSADWQRANDKLQARIQELEKLRREVDGVRIVRMTARIQELEEERNERFRPLTTLIESQKARIQELETVVEAARIVRDAFLDGQNVSVVMAPLSNRLCDLDGEG